MLTIGTYSGGRLEDLRSRRRAAAIACVSLLCLAATALAQREFGNFGRGRLKFRRTFPTTAGSRSSGSTTRRRPAATGPADGPSWSHGYPLAEQNLMKIMNELSYLGAHDEEINTLTLEDPELVQVSGGLHHRSRLVDADRSRGRGACAPTS